MGYQAPQLEDLQNLVVNLRKYYTGGNKERLDFITLVERLLESDAFNESEDAVNILIGAYLFEMEHIRQEYHLLPINSQMHSLLKKGLSITSENELSDIDIFIYVTAFYNYIKDKAPKALTENIFWQSNAALEKELVDVGKGIFENLSPHIDSIKGKKPGFNFLVKRLDSLEGTYNQLSPPGWLFGNAYVKEARLIDFINEYCRTYLDKSNPHDPNGLPFQLRMGALIYVMNIVEQNYKRNPGQRSNIYNLCKIASKQSCTADLGINQKGLYLSRLSEQLEEIASQHTNFLAKLSKEGKLNPAVRDLKQIQANLHQQISDNFKLQTASSPVEAKMISIASGSTSYMMHSGIRQACSALAAPAMIGAGLTGFAILGPGGALLGIASTVVLPIAVASIFSEVLGNISRAVGRGITGFVVLPFSLSARGLRALHSYYSHVETNPEALLKNKAFMDAVFSWPEDVITRDMKMDIEDNYDTFNNSRHDENDHDESMSIQPELPLVRR